jgi:hypothetical protein
MIYNKEKPVPTTRKWPGNYLETGQEPSNQPAKSTRRAEAAKNIHRVSVFGIF